MSFKSYNSTYSKNNNTIQTNGNNSSDKEYNHHQHHHHHHPFDNNYPNQDQDQVGRLEEEEEEVEEQQQPTFIDYPVVFSSSSAEYLTSTDTETHLDKDTTEIDLDTDTDTNHNHNHNNNHIEIHTNSNTHQLIIEDEEFNLPNSTSILSIYSSTSLLSDPQQLQDTLTPSSAKTTAGSTAATAATATATNTGVSFTNTVKTSVGSSNSVKPNLKQRLLPHRVKKVLNRFKLSKYTTKSDTTTTTTSTTSTKSNTKSNTPHKRQSSWIWKRTRLHTPPLPFKKEGKKEVNTKLAGQSLEKEEEEEEGIETSLLLSGPSLSSSTTTTIIHNNGTHNFNYSSTDNNTRTPSYYSSILRRRQQQQQQQQQDLQQEEEEYQKLQEEYQLEQKVVIDTIFSNEEDIENNTNGDNDDDDDDEHLSNDSSCCSSTNSHQYSFSHMIENSDSFHSNNPSYIFNPTQSPANQSLNSTTRSSSNHSQSNNNNSQSQQSIDDEGDEDLSFDTEEGEYEFDVIERETRTLKDQLGDKQDNNNDSNNGNGSIISDNKDSDNDIGNDDKSRLIATRPTTVGTSTTNINTTATTPTSTSNMGKNSGVELTPSGLSARPSSPSTHHHTTTSTGVSSSTTTSSSSSSTMRPRSICSTIIRKCIYQNPILNFTLFSIPTISDNLPFTLQSMTQNSKMVYLGLITSCLILNIVIIIPGYITSFIVTEAGVYVLNFFFIWCIGRFVLRLIAFPGSTNRVSNEIENEFTKYSLRMITNSAENVIEFCMLLLSVEEAATYGVNNGNSSGTSNSNHNISFVGSPKKKAVSRLVGRTGTVSSTSSRDGNYDIIQTWKRIEQYRNRVLGMFCDVLHCLLHENGQGEEETLSGTTEEERRQLLTKYANNRIVGDVGNLIPSVTKEARDDGEALYKILKRVLDDLDILEDCASDLLKANIDFDNKNNEKKLLTIEGFRAAQKLLISATQLNDFLPSLALDIHSSESTENDEDDNSSHRSRRRGMLANNPVVASVMAAFESVISLFDPKPHKSIFGLDVLRGSMLSRYAGARQFWFPRPKAEGGGMIDVIHIPSNAKNASGVNSRCIEKAVLFCNPNAGLIEVATGISLIGGNVGYGGNACSWTDFYIEQGFDIFLFNYAGFGRSHAGKDRAMKEKSTNAFSVLGRILCNCMFGFKPKPSTLKADALAAATHMIKEFSIDHLVVHGESIGGMAAASAARKLSTKNHVDDVTSVPKAYPALLVCDRTFCNLNAVASHLVGSWTSTVIPLLTPFWCTDVAGDFIAATCKKVIAQDAADAIIHFSSSLKKGVATAKELKKGSTKGLENVVETPLHYRMSDFENVGVLESKYAKASNSYRKVQAPLWPADKHFDLREAIHFAACARRIGKVATSIRKSMLFNSSQGSLTYDEEEEGIEITTMFSRDSSKGSDHDNAQSEEGDEKNNVVLEVWETLSRCDGLTGLPLGAAVKEGDDCVIDWLSCLIVFGSQRVTLKAEKRTKGQDELIVRASDFDMNVYNYEENEDASRLPPLPLPGVITLLTQLFQDKNSIEEVEKELDYCIRMLEYIMSRMTANNNVKDTIDMSHFRENFDGVTSGRYLNLTCGHNNQYSESEKRQLCVILTEACDISNNFA